MHGSVDFAASFAFLFWTLIVGAALVLFPFNINYVGDLINFLAKGASRGKEKGKERVVVPANVFFGREIINGEKGGILYQGPVEEAGEGLMGSYGGSGDAKDSICRAG